MSNKFKYLILILLLLGLFLPETASAFIFGTGFFDLFDHMLHGISEKTTNMIAVLLLVPILYLLGLGLLNLSSHYLETFIYQQTEWLDKITDLTEAGWTFTVGISNMLLIIIFVIIAFAFIFKIQSFQAKQSLIRLIVVAFLINFSLLFVYMLVDISQILYNTILPEEPFVSQVMSLLIQPVMNAIVAGLTIVGGLIIAFSIPIASAFAQILFASLFIVIFLPMIISWVIQGIFVWSLALMFFVFAILFAARVFVIQFLAIFAPIAFIALILPQTQKIWRFWLDTLISWLLLGILFLFLLVLGFAMLGLLKPDMSPTEMLPVTGHFMLAEGGVIIYYFAMFVYLLAILYIGKRFIPQGAQGVIGGIQGMANVMVARGIRPLTRKAADWDLPRRKIAEKRAERKERYARQMDTKIRENTQAPTADIVKWTRQRDEARDEAKVIKAMAGKTQEEDIAKMKPEQMIVALYKEQKKGFGRNEEKIKQMEKQLDYKRPDQVASARLFNQKEIELAVKRGVQQGMKEEDAREKVRALIMQDVVSKPEPEKLARSLSSEAAADPDFVEAAVKDPALFDEIQRRSSSATRQAMKNTFTTNDRFNVSINQTFSEEDKKTMAEAAVKMQYEPRWFGLGRDKAQKQEEDENINY